MLSPDLHANTGDDPQRHAPRQSALAPTMRLNAQTVATNYLLLGFPLNGRVGTVPARSLNLGEMRPDNPFLIPVDTLHLKIHFTYVLRWLLNSYADIRPVFAVRGHIRPPLQIITGVIDSHTTAQLEAIDIKPIARHP